MPYELRGKLCGYLCAECEEPLEGVTVRLYRNRPDQGVTGLAVAAPKDTIALLDDDAVAAKRGSLIAETVAAADGSFAFQLGPEQNYDGGAFEIDVYCGSVPHRKPMKTPPRPVQFSITTLQPLWKQTEGVRLPTGNIASRRGSGVASATSSAPGRSAAECWFAMHHSPPRSPG